MNLKEEDNNNYFHHKLIIEDATCSKCKLPLVKSDKMKRNKELITVFTSKCTICDAMSFLPLDHQFVVFVFAMIARLLCFSTLVIS